MEHLPVATGAVQESPIRSVTTTFPVGVPLAGATGFTVKLTVTGCPVTEGLGVWAVIVVQVKALDAFCDTPGEVLPLKLLLPA
jgi:hypothetical protein